MTESCSKMKAIFFSEDSSTKNRVVVDSGKFCCVPIVSVVNLYINQTKGELRNSVVLSLCLYRFLFLEELRREWRSNVAVAEATRFPLRLPRLYPRKESVHLAEDAEEDEPGDHAVRRHPDGADRKSVV